MSLYYSSGYFFIYLPNELRLLLFSIYENIRFVKEPFGAETVQQFLQRSSTIAPENQNLQCYIVCFICLTVWYFKYSE